MISRRKISITNNLSKDEMKKLIPKGIYCDSGNERCPWFQHIEDRKIHAQPPSKEYALCEVSSECGENCWTTLETSCRQYQSVARCEYMDFTDWDEETLLWDGVKECGENDDLNDEECDFIPKEE